MLLYRHHDQLSYLVSLQSYGEYQIRFALVTTDVTPGPSWLGRTWLCSDRAWFLSDVSYNVHAGEKQNKIERHF